MRLGSHETSKLNRAVPLEVETFNNFGQLKVGQENFSLNFYPQFQKPLLLEFSQKRVMELLSASKALDDMNTVHFALSKLREQNRGAFRTIDNILTSTKANLSIVNFQIQEVAPSIFALQTSKDKYVVSRDNYKDLQDIREELINFKVVNNNLEVTTKVLDAKSMADSSQEALQSLQELGTLSTTIESLEREIEVLEIRASFKKKNEEYELFISSAKEAIEESHLLDIISVKIKVNSLQLRNLRFKRGQLLNSLLTFIINAQQLQL